MNTMITTQELRQKYLDFFKSKGHAIVPSASLLPDNDSSVLFTTAGMQPLVPYLVGEKHPLGTRLASVQKCVRTSDIDEVGDNTHLTFFEMLGNWSLGDYFKTESIAWSWEFLTNPAWLGIDPGMLAITVFAGDAVAPKDEESVQLWKNLGLNENKISYLLEDNWWQLSDKNSPCGPDTEIFYYVGSGQPEPASNPKDRPQEWVEIWNNVFMQFYKDEAGTCRPLVQKNVDTGMGLERTCAILNGFKNVYQIETFQAIIKTIENCSDHNYGEVPELDRSFRIIADHLRAAVFIIGDPRGVEPSNLDQGYVVRKLIRRAIRHGKLLNILENFTINIAQKIIEQYQAAYPELIKNQEKIIAALTQEEDRFRQTLEKGLKQFLKISATFSANQLISGSAAFNLYETYGFPLEITKDLAEEKGYHVDEAEFNQQFEKHKELSRTATVGKFKGGLADHSEVVVKYHTACHLLNQALRLVLGEHVAQRGSNLTEERLRFDFSHPTKMTVEEIKKVEDIVNEQIKKDLPVSFQEMTPAQAKADGAHGVFEEKYGDLVKVYAIGNFSKEICGGPHVTNTGTLGHFKIIKEEASSSGIRRIKAILE
ncbi:MAG: alanine--tRNA ligase [Candidatus Komeilibacteria bacterium]|nr:alanine--tRNA ligase [Candidatus Komeilibacteria bacterium]